jgi:hypothetical protein
MTKIIDKNGSIKTVIYTVPSVCANGTVENSDVSYTAAVASGGTLLLPDIDVDVNGVNEGLIPSVQDIDIILTDGTNPVTPDAVTIIGNTVTIEAPDATVENSDASYTDTVVSGGTLILPDETINIVDEDGNPLDTITFPVYTDPNIDITSYCPAVTPVPVGATLMKTGQTTSYRTGDDGDLEAGRATDFLTLASNNPFGSTARFTDELGGSTYTNNIVIDWSTYNGSDVLGYYSGGLGLNRNWDTAVDWGIGLSVGTFTSNWRLTNVREIQNLIKYEGSNRALNYAPFNLSTAISFWTSTTYVNTTTSAFVQTNDSFILTTAPKTASYRTMAVRTFTVTGTTLT